MGWPTSHWLTSTLSWNVDTGSSRSIDKSQKSLTISQCRRAKHWHANGNFSLGCMKEDVDVCKESSPMCTCLEPNLSFSLLVPLNSLPVSLQSLIQRTILTDHKKILISSQENHPLSPRFFSWVLKFPAVLPDAVSTCHVLLRDSSLCKVQCGWAGSCSISHPQPKGVSYL